MMRKTYKSFKKYNVGTVWAFKNDRWIKKEWGWKYIGICTKGYSYPYPDELITQPHEKDTYDEDQ